MRPMTTRRRRTLVALAIAGAAIAATVIVATTLLPPWLRGTVERVASRALGRELEIAGPFEVSLLWRPRLTAGDVALANAPWGSEPSMARVGRVTVVFDLASLWSRPLRVRELEIEGCRLLLEADGEGRGNWVLAPRPASSRPAEAGQGPPVVFDRVAVRDVELVYRPRPGAAPVTLGVRSLQVRLEPATRMIDVAGGGTLDGAPWEVAGRLGTLDEPLRGPRRPVRARRGAGGDQGRGPRAGRRAHDPRGAEPRGERGGPRHRRRRSGTSASGRRCPGHSGSGVGSSPPRTASGSTRTPPSARSPRRRTAS